MNKVYSYLSLVMVLLFIIISSMDILATPAGTTITLIKNETITPGAADFLNTSGGTISVVNLDAKSQNVRWKAYVGNVSGQLVLEDSDGYSIFDWSMTSFTGEVYATRFSESVDWTNINCSNATHILNEEIVLNHTSNPNDNISATFDTKDHNQFLVGTVTLSENSCFSVHTYVNDTNQTTDFEEVLLYDGTNSTNGNIVYGTILEQDAQGYHNGTTYDFQMIVPEMGTSGWSGSTAYYFYAELS